MKAPVIFLGHGSPTNASADNAFTRKLKDLRALYPNPRAVLCVSAHWMTEGTWVTAMEQPQTIHDFYGFPDELFQIQYPAPGSPEVAELVARTAKVNLDKEMWGLDHGTWAVLRHVFPEANIPVLQLSVYMSQPAEYHYELGKRLRPLREQGILIVGSGNIVHNLKQIKWEEKAPAYPWAKEFDLWVRDQIATREFDTLLKHATRDEAGKLSIPSPDHWYPLLYVLGASEDGDSLHVEYEEIQNASISMRSFSFRAT